MSGGNGSSNGGRIVRRYFGGLLGVGLLFVTSAAQAREVLRVNPAATASQPRQELSAKPRNAPSFDGWVTGLRVAGTFISFSAWRAMRNRQRTPEE